MISWVATTGGISGEMIRDLMLESVQRRFGKNTASILSNGSPIPAAAIALTKRSPSHKRSALSRASRQCDRRSRMVWLSSSSKRSSEIIFKFMIARMHSWPSRNFRGGSRTTTKTFRTKRCEWSHPVTSSAASIMRQLTVRSHTGNSITDVSLLAAHGLRLKNFF